MPDQDDVGGADRDVGATADGQTQIGGGQRRAVVDAVTHHRDRRALRAELVDEIDLALGQDLGDDLGDPDLWRPPRRRTGLSPVKSMVRIPRVQLRDCFRGGSLHRVGDAIAAHRSPSRRRRRLSRRAASRPAGAACTDVPGRDPRGVPTATDRPDVPAHHDRGPRGSRRPGRARRTLRRSRWPRHVRRPLEAAASARPRRDPPVVQGHSTTDSSPLVTVPVLSNTTVSIWREASKA